MKIKIGGLAAITGAAMLLLAAPAFGQYYGPYNLCPALINGETPAIVDFPSPYSSENLRSGRRGWDLQWASQRKPRRVCMR